MLDLAQSRLSWARNQLYQYWNPDWKNQGTAGGDGTAAGLSPQPLVIMDGRWWRWNIAFALLPAILIGTYCEFRGQYLMYNYHQEQELCNLRRLMGDEFVEKHRDALIRPPPENFLIRSWNAIAELLELLRGRSDASGFSSESVPAADSPTAPATPNQSPSDSATVSGSSFAAQNSASPTAETTTTIEPINVEQLAARIQKLEELLILQAHRRQENEFEHLQQSGVRNRMEATLIESWKRIVGNDSSDESKESQKEQKQPASSPASSLTATMSRIFEEAMEMARSSSAIPDKTSQKAESTSQKAESTCELEDATENTKVKLQDKTVSTSSRVSNSVTADDERTNDNPQSSRGKSWWSWSS
jgi:hypothetical protein